MANVNVLKPGGDHGDVFTLINGQIIDGITGRYVSDALDLAKRGFFGVWYKANSEDGVPKVRLYYEMSPTLEEEDFIIPVSADDIETLLTNPTALTVQYVGGSVAATAEVKEDTLELVADASMRLRYTGAEATARASVLDAPNGIIVQHVGGSPAATVELKENSLELVSDASIRLRYTGIEATARASVLNAPDGIVVQHVGGSPAATVEVLENLVNLVADASMKLRYTGGQASARASVLDGPDGLSVQHVGGSAAATVEVKSNSLELSADPGIRIRYVGAEASSEARVLDAVEGFTIQYVGGSPTATVEVQANTLELIANASMQLRYVGAQASARASILDALDGISVRYVGAEATATVEVLENSLVLCAPALNVVATIDITDAAYNTLAELASAIDILPGWSCNLGDSLLGTELSINLAIVAAQDCKTSVYTCALDRCLFLEAPNGTGDENVGPGGKVFFRNAAYDTLTELAAYLDGLVDYTCVMGSAAEANADTNTLSAVAATDIKTAAVWFTTTSPITIDYDLTIAANDTVTELVALIDGLNAWTCSAGALMAGTELTVHLTVVAAQDCKTAGYACVMDRCLYIEAPNGTGDVNVGPGGKLFFSDAAYDTIGEIATVLDTLGDYTCVLGSQWETNVDSNTLAAAAPVDIKGAPGAWFTTSAPLTVTYDLTAGAYDTISEIVASIDGEEGWTCTAGAQMGGTELSKYLAVVAAQACQAAPYVCLTERCLFIEAPNGAGDANVGPGGKIFFSDASYNTLSELTTFLNGLGDYTCIMGSAAETAVDTNTLSAVAATDIKSADVWFATTAEIVVAYDLTDAACDTLSELVAAIDGEGGWTCTIGAQMAGTELSKYLAVIGPQACQAAAYTCLAERCLFVEAPNATGDVNVGPGGKIWFSDATYNTLEELTTYLDGLGDYTCIMGSSFETAVDSNALATAGAADIKSAPGAWLTTSSSVLIAYDLTLAANDTITELVAVIDAEGGWTCTKHGDMVGTELSKNLKVVTAQACQAAPYTCVMDRCLFVEAPNATPDTNVGLGGKIFFRDPSYDALAELVAFLDGLGDYTCVMGSQYEAAAVVTSLSLAAKSATDIKTTPGGWFATDTSVIAEYDLTAAAFDTLAELVASIDAEQGWTCSQGATMDGLEKTVLLEVLGPTACKAEGLACTIGLPKVKTLALTPMRFFRLVAQGLSGNPTDTVVTAKLFVQ